MHLEKQIIKAHFDHLWAKPIGSYIFGSDLSSSQKEKEVSRKVSLFSPTRCLLFHAAFWLTSHHAQSYQAFPEGVLMGEVGALQSLLTHTSGRKEKP